MPPERRTFPRLIDTCMDSNLLSMVQSFSHPFKIQSEIRAMCKHIATTTSMYAKAARVPGAADFHGQAMNFLVLLKY
jgi:hypothetical protein